MSDSPRDLGHTHDNRDIKPVFECPRCDWARGSYALEVRP